MKLPAQRLARACRRYLDTWDAEKVRRERAEREGLDAGVPTHPAKEASLAEEFGKPFPQLFILSKRLNRNAMLQRADLICMFSREARWCWDELFSQVLCNCTVVLPVLWLQPRQPKAVVKR
jgi:hypothetical protein